MGDTEVGFRINQRILFGYFFLVVILPASVFAEPGKDKDHLANKNEVKAEGSAAPEQEASPSSSDKPNEAKGDETKPIAPKATDPVTAALESLRGNLEKWDSKILLQFSNELSQVTALTPEKFDSMVDALPALSEDSQENETLKKELKDSFKKNVALLGKNPEVPVHSLVVGVAKEKLQGKKPGEAIAEIKKLKDELQKQIEDVQKDLAGKKAQADEDLKKAIEEAKKGLGGLSDAKNSGENNPGLDPGAGDGGAGSGAGAGDTGQGSGAGAGTPPEPPSPSENTKNDKRRDRENASPEPSEKKLSDLSSLFPSSSSSRDSEKEKEKKPSFKLSEPKKSDKASDSLLDKIAEPSQKTEKDTEKESPPAVSSGRNFRKDPYFERGSTLSPLQKLPDPPYGNGGGSSGEKNSNLGNFSGPSSGGDSGSLFKGIGAGRAGGFGGSTPYKIGNPGGYMGSSGGGDADDFEEGNFENTSDNSVKKKFDTRVLGASVLPMESGESTLR